MTDESGAVSRRPGSKLAVDDPQYCKWCGVELPELLVDGPIAGDGTDCKAVELCGDCKGRQMKMAVRRMERDSDA